MPFQELESKLKEVAANGANATGNGAHGTGSTETIADNVGKRVATKFIAQVEIKEGQINPAVDSAKVTSTDEQAAGKRAAADEQSAKKTAVVEQPGKKTTTVEAAKKTSIAENTVQKKDVRQILKLHI